MSVRNQVVAQRYASLAHLGVDLHRDTPSVAILLCTLNGAQFLRDQLASIALQDHANWTLVASDDGSRDMTVDILSEFGSVQLDGFRVKLRKGPKQGAAANFLSLATDQSIRSDYYAYCDQDDVWARNKLRRALSYLETVPKGVPALYCSRTRLVDQHGNPYGLSPLFRRAPSFANALVQNIGGGNTMVFNRAARDLIAQTKGHEVVAHDWWTYMLVSGAGGRVIYDPWPSLDYRQHGENQVGANKGLLPKLKRISMLAEGRFSEWNSINVRTLLQCQHLLSEPNNKLLRQFVDARAAPSPLSRLTLLSRSGIYRQTVSGHLALHAASLLGKL